MRFLEPFPATLHEYLRVSQFAVDRLGQPIQGGSETRSLRLRRIAQFALEHPDRFAPETVADEVRRNHHSAQRNAFQDVMQRRATLSETGNTSLTRQKSVLRHPR